MRGGDASSSALDFGGSTERIDAKNLPHRKKYFGLLTLRQYDGLTSDFHAADLEALVKQWEQSGGAVIPVKRLQDQITVLSGSTLERRRRTLAYLDAIDREGFPLAAIVCHLTWKTAAFDDPQRGADEYARMVTEHGNAYEWLRRAEGRIGLEDWNEYRTESVSP